MSKRIEFGRYDKVVEPSVGGGLLIGEIRAIMNNSFELKDVIDKVAARQNVVWVNNGKWSMHEMLLALLDVTGPGVVHIATYAMGETPVRVISQLKQLGIIKELYCAIDNRIDTRTAGSLQMIMTIATSYAMSDIHAKVTVIENEEWRLCVIGSANYTVNKRMEAGVVLIADDVADQQLAWIKDCLKHGNK